MVNSHLPLPVSVHYEQIEPNNNLANDKILDDSLMIISMSISRSSRMRNQAFLTFFNETNALQFLNEYKDKQLKVGGRVIKMQMAKKDSYVGLYMKNHDLVKRILKTRNRREELREDPEKLKEHQLKRRLRRLRSKLRARGETEENISIAVENYMKCSVTVEAQREPVNTPEHGPKHKVREEINENPPHAVLLATNLPSSISVDGIKSVIPTDNLKEIRLVSIRNVAFIEYDSVEAARKVLESIGTSLNCPGGKAKLTYAKK